MQISVSVLQEKDKNQWQAIYQGYADFYQVTMNKQILEKVCSWIFDESMPFFCLVAKNENDEMLGLMHCREMPSPLRGTMVGFLDDLFVLAEYRGSGCVQKLYQALNDLGKQRGWPLIRWITAEDNYRARALYDKISEKTQWQTYQMSIK